MKHFYQFYRGREDFFRTTIPFLRLGLENREACLWILSQAIGVLEAVEAFRLDPLIRFIENGQLCVLGAERWYLDRGRFSGRRALKKLSDFVEERKRRGFSGVRVVGDVGWLEDEDWSEFQRYESEVRPWIQSGQIVALCAYPIQRCSVAQTQDILDRHDSVFLTKL